jgi:hypothetical protein
MQRPVHRVAGSYRVTFSPEAWRLIGIMPSVTFQSLQLALERIADTHLRPPDGAQAEQSATMDGLTVVYTVDDTERVLTVVNILKTEPPAAP